MLRHTLDYVKHINIASLKAAQSLELGIFDALKALLVLRGEMLNITHILLQGTITAEEKRQRPFRIVIESTVMGKKIDPAPMEWAPGQRTEFLERLALKALNSLA